MYQYSSLTEQDTLAVRDDGRLLVISYDSIMNYHGGAMPAGVALAFRMFTGLTARYYTLFGDVPERKRVPRGETRGKTRGKTFEKSFEKGLTKGTGCDRISKLSPSGSPAQRTAH